MPYQLLPLPYGYDALEPYIDARTLEIHHDKHHATYLANLNKALESAPQLQSHAEDLLKELSAVPENIRTAVRNNGGGFVNHTFYWEGMAPQAGGERSAGSPLAEAIRNTFGSFASFQEKFSTVTVARFGSGWGWLSLDKEGVLVVHSTPNQDSPLSEGMVPLLTCDVWEHAYYLKYQNRRPDYVSAWWNLVNWERVAERYRTAHNLVDRASRPQGLSPGLAKGLLNPHLSGGVTGFLPKGGTDRWSSKSPYSPHPNSLPGNDWG